MKTNLQIPFEIHITTELLNSDGVSAFAAFCKASDTKPLLIELARGQFLQHPMLSKVIKANSLDNAKAIAHKYANQLQIENFPVNRVKIEVPATCYSLFEPKNLHMRPYFEWHGKTRISEVNALKSFCEEHGAHLSINALKGDPQKRFITLREYGSFEVFQSRLAALKRGLEHGGWTIAKEESEYCIYDTNTLLDNGWLTL